MVRYNYIKDYALSIIIYSETTLLILIKYGNILVNMKKYGNQS
jgi:hypothetical protein